MIIHIHLYSYNIILYNNTQQTNFNNQIITANISNNKIKNNKSNIDDKLKQYNRIKHI